MTEWISVNEKLPDYDTIVLVFVYTYSHGHSKVMTLGKLEKQRCSYGHEHDVWKTYDGDTCVTHWMPLPKPPVEAAPEADS